MTQRVSTPPMNRLLLALCGLLILIHAARIARGRPFPGAWNDVGGILFCVAVAYPFLPSVRHLLARDRPVAFFVGLAALLAVSSYCTFVLGG